MLGLQAVPTEYYSLLGLPMFTSDRKEIRAAHRRVVKLCHPDVLGVDAVGDLLMVVREAYEVLSDDGKREDYDEMLKLAKPTLATSVWGEGISPQARGVFVDETLCQKCYNCVNIASSTFDVHDMNDTTRKEKAYVAVQYGDAEEVVKEAVKACPTKAIKFLSRENLAIYEYAMTKCATMRERFASTGAREEEMPTVQDLLLDYQIEELLAMDMEKALQDAAEPFAEMETAEELTTHARHIKAAAATVPEEVRAKMWPDNSAVRKAMGEELLQGKKIDPVATATSEQSAGLQRASLKMSVFRLFDEDEDGFLFQNELRTFAEKFGFEGNDADWIVQYKMLCSELNCQAGQGVSMRAFSMLVDDDELCYMSDGELAACLTDSNRLPRAGN